MRVFVSGPDEYFVVFSALIFLGLTDLATLGALAGLSFLVVGSRAGFLAKLLLAGTDFLSAAFGICNTFDVLGVVNSDQFQILFSSDQDCPSLAVR
jgi:hypothetical protein